MVAGHLREKRGYYHIVLSYTDENGKRQTPSKTTGLPVKGNKKRAEAMMQAARKEMEAALECRIRRKENPDSLEPSEVLFTVFILDWLEMMKSNVEVTTYASYSMCIKSRIVPYFDKHHPGLMLKKVTPKHIQDYYSYELRERGVTTNTVIRRHANIRKALQYAFKVGLIDNNPADRVERPKKNQFTGSIYNEKELEQLFELVRDKPIELGVILAAFYGLRRSEAVGLKWESIDFEANTITIEHTVTIATVDGKTILVVDDTTKTKASFRTLPLIPSFRAKLLEVKAEQEQNQKLCGKCYNKKESQYIYTDPLGNRIKPDYLTDEFPKFMERNGFRRMRFHDLRHTYAAIFAYSLKYTV